jgi:hypothetical protein
MVDNQKVVVTLLLITIILSVLSVIVTLSIQFGGLDLFKSQKNPNVIIVGDPVDSNSASVSLGVQPSGGTG